MTEIKCVRKREKVFSDFTNSHLSLWKLREKGFKCASRSCDRSNFPRSDIRRKRICYSTVCIATASFISAASFSVTRNGKRVVEMPRRKIRHGANALAAGNAVRLSGPMMAAGWIFLSLHWDLEASLVARFPVAVVLHPKLPASHVRLIRLELSGQPLTRLHNLILGGPSTIQYL
jgi:hypothetical protein